MRKRSLLLAIVVFASLLLASSVCLAADTAKLTVQMDLSDKYFWTYPYITTDGKIRMPAAVNLEWTIGTSSKVTTQTVIVPAKTNGEYTIVTERGAIVNIQIYVVDAKKVVLGGGSLQVRNSGQQEKFYIALPDSTSPIISHETGRPQ